MPLRCGRRLAVGGRWTRGGRRSVAEKERDGMPEPLSRRRCSLVVFVMGNGSRVGGGGRHAAMALKF